MIGSRVSGKFVVVLTLDFFPHEKITPRYIDLRLFGNTEKNTETEKIYRIKLINSSIHAGCMHENSFALIAGMF